jgi:hypothetical protein
VYRDRSHEGNEWERHVVIDAIEPFVSGNNISIYIGSLYRVSDLSAGFTARFSA